jgi:hypothetical protein
MFFVIGAPILGTLGPGPLVLDRAGNQSMVFGSVPDYRRGNRRTYGDRACRSARLSGSRHPDDDRYADQRERAHGLDALTHDAIAKPFTIADIRFAVASALAVAHSKR